MTTSNGYRVNPLAKKDIEKITLIFRKFVGYDSNDRCNVLKILEFVMPQIDCDFCLEILPKEQMGLKEGNTIPREHKIQLREDVYDGLLVNDKRARFTAAHELGHLMLHSQITPEYARSVKEHQVFEDSEWQANQFAAYLLMPTSGCNGLNAMEISNKYDTSIESSIIREREIKKFHS